jgi:sigma-B regulation protein RsbU (phosphoserine phosphatase)
MDTQTLAYSGLRAASPRQACIEVSVERRSARCDRLRGGDLVDVYHEADGSACVLLADVSSKGIRSIAHVEHLQAEFRRAARVERSPSYIMAALNRLRFESTGDEPEPFATVFVARFDRAKRLLRYASGGHDTALVFRGGEHRHLKQTGPVIGVIPNAIFRDCSVKFDSGDILVIATDGFTECRRDRAPFEQLGTSGIVRALTAEAAHSPHSVSTVVGAFADAFTGGAYRDDATLVAVARC